MRERTTAGVSATRRDRSNPSLYDTCLQLGHGSDKSLCLRTGAGHRIMGAHDRTAGRTLVLPTPADLGAGMNDACPDPTLAPPSRGGLRCLRVGGGRNNEPQHLAYCADGAINAALAAVGYNFRLLSNGWRLCVS
jgi:hypothetical protein